MAGSFHPSPSSPLSPLSPSYHSGHPLTLFTLIDRDDPERDPYWQRLFHTSYPPHEQGIIDVVIEPRKTTEENDDSWKDIARRHEEGGFSFLSNPSHTLFRLIIVSHPSSSQSTSSQSHWELILFCHHALFDARGGTFFLRKLFEEYEALQQQQQALSIDQQSSSSSSLSSPSDITSFLSTLIVANEGASFPSGPNLTPTTPLHHSSSDSSPSPYSIPSNPSNTGLSSSSNVAIWPLPLENRIRTTPTFWFLLKGFLQDRIPWLKPKPNVWVGPQHRGVTLRPTSDTIWVKIKPSTLSALLSLCRSQNTTINAALWSAVIFGLVRVWRSINEEGKEAQTGDKPISLPSGQLSLDSSVLFSLLSPVDMRSRVMKPISSTSKDGKGSSSLASSMSVHSPMVVGANWMKRFKASSMEFWNVAREVRKDIEGAVPEAIQTNGLSRWLPRPTLPWFFKRETIPPNGRAITMEISNLGCIDFEPSYGLENQAEKANHSLHSSSFASPSSSFHLSQDSPIESSYSNNNLQIRDVWFGRYGVRDPQLFTIHAITPSLSRGLNLSISSVSQLIDPSLLLLLGDSINLILDKVVESSIQDQNSSSKSSSPAHDHLSWSYFFPDEPKSSSS